MNSRLVEGVERLRDYDTPCPGCANEVTGMDLHEPDCPWPEVLEALAEEKAREPVAYETGYFDKHDRWYRTGLFGADESYDHNLTPPNEPGYRHFARALFSHDSEGDTK